MSVRGAEKFKNQGRLRKRPEVITELSRIYNIIFLLGSQLEHKAPFGVSVIKSKAVPQHTYGGAWRERMYSSYSFTTSALDGDELSALRPDRALPPGKGLPVPIVQEAGWAPEPVWTQSLEEISLASAGYRTSIGGSSSP
jgi:hypothetical protein